MLDEEYFPHEKRRAPVSQSQEAFIGLGGARRMSSMRPKSAPGHRSTSTTRVRPSSASATPQAHTKKESYDPPNSAIPQRSVSPILNPSSTIPEGGEGKRTTLLDFDEANKKSLKTINNVQLSQEDWNKILLKYSIQDISDLKFHYLKKGTGTTTKFDHIAKERPKSASSSKLRKSTGPLFRDSQEIAMGVDESKDFHDSQYKLQSMHEGTMIKEDPNEFVEDVAIQFMRERNAKKRQEDENFAKQLIKEKEQQILQIKRCIEEINQFCQFLQKPYTYKYLDDKHVTKEVYPTAESSQIGISGIVHTPTGYFSDLAKNAFYTARYADNPDGQPVRPKSANGTKKKSKKTSINQAEIRQIPLARFYQEHEQFYKEYKNFVKHNHPTSTIESMKAPESKHFIGVNDLYTAAKQREEEVLQAENDQLNKSKKYTTASNKSTAVSKPTVKISIDEDDDDDGDVIQTNADANYNEVLRRNVIISKQQQIIAEFDQMQELLLSQMQEIQKKGWNVNFRDFFLFSESH